MSACRMPTGDTVAKDQGLVTLESDKATMEVPSPASGVVKEIRVKVGDKVSEGDVIAMLEVGEGKDDAKPEQKEEKKPEGKKAEAPEAPEKKAESKSAEKAPEPVRPSADLPAVNETSFSKAHASPSVRKFARELGVDLGKVNGSGVKGRITHDDVKNFVKSVMRGGDAVGGGGSAWTGDTRVFADYHFDMDRWQRMREGSSSACPGFSHGFVSSRICRAYHGVFR